MRHPQRTRRKGSLLKQSPPHGYRCYAWPIRDPLGRCGPLNATSCPWLDLQPGASQAGLSGSAEHSRNLVLCNFKLRVEGGKAGGKRYWERRGVVESGERGVEGGRGWLRLRERAKSGGEAGDEGESGGVGRNGSGDKERACASGREKEGATGRAVGGEGWGGRALTASGSPATAVGLDGVAWGGRVAMALRGSAGVCSIDHCHRARVPLAVARKQHAT